MTLSSLTKAHGRVRAWKRLALSALGLVATTRSCCRSSSRITKAKLLRELIAMVALALGLLFALSFLCIALIATAFGMSYFIDVVWGVAAAWIAVSIAAFFVLRVQLRDASHLVALRSELRKGAQVSKEAL